MKYLLAAILFVIPMTACEDRYRYPCQDPDNFSKTECNPPKCEADGSCTHLLLRQK